MRQPCKTEEFISFENTIPLLLDGIGAADALSGQSCILIKPNLVNLSPPPVTLPVDAARAIINYIGNHSSAKIIIGEGTGEPDITTWDVFRKHGYEELASETGVELVDMNDAELIELSNPECTVFPTFMMPKIIMESFVISAATLKAHSLARVTLSMKNMIGVAPPTHYQRGGYWRKSAFHHQMQTSIFDLNRYRKPDLAFIDGSLGLADHHLGGPACDPPVKTLVAGFDPVKVDAYGSELLGIPWQQVGHIKMADGVLGCAE
jgi:uncharacterized protein (DUF362 family)